MQSEATLKRHAALIDQMAQARGLDLEEQMLRGKLTVAELEDAVLRCTGCAQPDACEFWLSVQQDTVSEAPAFCRNAEVFRTLERG